MIRVERLSKTFKGQRVLDDISFDIPTGEVLALLGESGTGKSVLLKHMMGLLKPDSGKVWINEEEITALSERELLRVRQSIGYVFQEGALYDFMTVFENIAFPLREHTKGDRRQIARRVGDVLAMVDLSGVESKYPSQLSGGMRKRVGLARAIVLDSSVLFCDEPTSGLDPIRSRSITDLIKDISGKLNCTTVITSHDMYNALRVSDRLVLIRQGKIVAMGDERQIRTSSDSFVREFIGEG